MKRFIKLFTTSSPHKKNLKKSALLSITALLFGFNSYAQGQSNDELLKGFDEKAVIEEMNQKGIHDHDRESYMAKQKQLFISKKMNKKNVNPIVFKDTNITCTNIGFEDSTFTGWTGYTGNNNTSLTPLSSPVYGIVPGRHTITYGSGLDFFGGFPVVAPGSKHSAQVGDALNGAYGEQLQQTFKVNADNVYFTYRYAVVLNDNGHIASQQPFFLITMLDALNDTVPCSTYKVTASASIPGFVTSTQSAFGAPVRYKSWTTITVDLNAYLNQYVTIVFLTGDCTQTGHFGYAYVDAVCGDTGQDYFCPGDSSLTFCALDGYKKYEWFNMQSGALIDTTPCITVNFPVLGDQYRVKLTPITTNDTNCIITIIKQVRLNPHPIIGDYLIKHNVFTPNGDNVNEKFSTSQFKYVKEFEMKIFNRWGKVVFESNDHLVEWDGKINGNEADEGVYYWMAYYVGACSLEESPPKIETHGFVHLFR